VTVTGMMVNPGLMFAPFRGLRYAEAQTLGGRLAPPYDVIGTEDRRALTRQDPYNIVMVDLPVPAAGDDPYDNAAAILASWQRRGVLVRDKEPNAYVLRTTTRRPDGSERRRTGVFLAVAALPFAPGSRVRPHEQTHSGPKEDRRRLTLATGCNLSPVFLLATDSRGELASALAEATAQAPWATCEAIGARHEVWIVPTRQALKMAMVASDEPVYIADGHHRYETAVRVKEEAPKPWKDGAQRTLAHLVSFRDPGLEILPTHRIVEGKPLPRAEVLRAASPFFGRALPDQKPTLTAVFADGSDAPMVLRPEADLSSIPGLPEKAPARSLGVALADAVFIRAVLGGLIGGELKLRYTPDAAEARKAATAKGTAASVLLQAPTLEEVKAVSDAGQFMPPKSTFFAPKVPTGVVMRMFEGEV
jgi:uncharacterized protein (DUF1015 family)